jgi:photosystem II stability/assembly factor-like uncharacterized protein
MFQIHRVKKNWLLTITLGLLALVVMSVQAQEIVLTETFDNPELPGWDHTPNATVVEGVLRVEGGGFAFRGGDWSDVEMSVRARREGAGELIVLFQGSGGQSYIVVLGGNFVLLQREVGGELVELAGVGDIEIPHVEWFQLQIRAMAGEISVRLNEQLIVEAVDTDPLPGGGIGFEVLGEAVGEFDDLELISVSGGEPEPPETSSEVAAVGELAWVRTGGPLGGLGYDVRMRPDDPDMMYVSDAFAGVFISSDGGELWFPSNQGITTKGGPSGDAIPIFSLTVDPNDYDTIWVGTQSVRGIFMSADGGETWERRDNGVVENEGITFRGFTIDPNDSNTVYAAGEVSSWTWAGEERLGREFDMVQGVVYKTNDKGMHWTAIWRGNNLARYIWIDPRDSDVLYVSTGIFDREAANSDPTARIPGGEGVIKSTDGGQTWQNINNGLENLYVGSLFMHPEDPDILLAAAGNNQYHERSGVYITTNGGESWQQTLNEGGTTSVEFSTSDPNIAYAADPNAVYRSEDGGFTWEQVDSDAQGWGPPGVLAGFPIDLQIDPRNTDRIFANNYGGGNFLSTDGGATWVVASSGYTGAQVRAIAVDPNNPAIVYAAARSGIFASADGGSEWQGLSFPPAKVLEWNAVAIDPTNSLNILAANNWMGNILRSTNGGQSWAIAFDTIQHGLAWRSFAFSPSNPNIVYAGSAAFSTGGGFDDRLDGVGIYVSSNSGESWTAANDVNIQNAQVAGLAVHPTDAQVVYAAATFKGVFKTTDGGQTWNRMTQGLPGNSNAISIAVSPDQPDQVYMGLDGQGLYSSNDGGSTWVQSSSGLNPEAGIGSIVFDPNNSQVMYVSDRGGGVFRSEDGGQMWQQINNDLLTRAVNALSISSDGFHLYAATEGGGVFRLDLDGQAPISTGSIPLPDSSKVGEQPADDQSDIDQTDVDKPVEQIEPEPMDEPDGGLPPNLMLIMGIGVLAVVIVGGVLFVILRKSR